MSTANETFFQHRFDHPSGYLHHRPPYLLIDSVDQIQDQHVHASVAVRSDSFFIQGHFPGAPVLPGAIMQEMTTQTAGVLIAANFNPMQEHNTEDPDFNEFALGVLVKLKRGRYRGFARPGDQLKITVTLDERFGQVFDFSGQIQCGENVIYKNAFQLTNMRSDTLKS